MKVSETRIAPSPAGDGRIRYSAVVEYDDVQVPAEEL
jgi:hypothetical protein